MAIGDGERPRGQVEVTNGEREVNNGEKEETMKRLVMALEGQLEEAERTVGERNARVEELEGQVRVYMDYIVMYGRYSNIW